MKKPRVITVRLTTLEEGISSKNTGKALAPEDYLYPYFWRPTQIMFMGIGESLS